MTVLKEKFILQLAKKKDPKLIDTLRDAYSIPILDEIMSIHAFTQIHSMETFGENSGNEMQSNFIP